MSRASVMQRVMAVGLAFILVSCSATRYSTTGPTRQQDLARYAILFETQPNGSVTHLWKPLSEVDLTQYQHPWGLAHPDRHLERTSTTPLTDDDILDMCEQVEKRCLERCHKSPFPGWASSYRSYLPNTKAGRAKAKALFCARECAQERDSCIRELQRKRQEAVEFSSAERAVDWIKRHKEKLVAGAIVVIAAVVFIVFVCGSGGCVILIPIIVIASSTAPTGPYLAEACQ